MSSPAKMDHFPRFPDFLFFSTLTAISTFASTSPNVLAHELSHTPRFALPLTTILPLLSPSNAPDLVNLLTSYPTLESIILLVGDIDTESVQREDGYLFEAKQVPKSGVLMSLMEEMFQPWRAFAELLSIGMVEDALGRYVERVLEKVGKEGAGLEVKFKLAEFRDRIR